MKKKLLSLVIALMSITTIANAQAALLVLIFGDQAASENFFFSLKGAANISQSKATGESEFSLGPYFGLTGTIKINEKWDLIPEFAALSRVGSGGIPLRSTGNIELDNLLGPDAKVKRVINYMDIPISAHYNLSPKVGLGAGFLFSYMMSATDRFEGNEINYTMDIKDELKSFDYGFIFDFRYTLVNQRGGKGIDLLVRYYQGLPAVKNDSSLDSKRRSYFQIGLGFPFVNID